MTRLLAYTETYARGGGNRYMVDCANALAPSFSEVMIATNKSGIFPEDIAHLSCPATTRQVSILTRASIQRHISWLPTTLRRMFLALLVLMEPFFFLSNMLCFAFLIRRYKPSCILSCNGGYPAAQSCLAMIVAAKLCRVKSMLSIVSMPTPRRRYTYYYEKCVDRLVWRAADAVIVNASAIAKALTTLRDMPTDAAHIVYNSIADIPSPPRVRAATEILTLGCVARLDAMKGVFFLFDAFAELAKEFPNLRLVLAGDGDASAELKKRCTQHGLEARVDFLGHYSGDIAALLASFDIYVFPSLWEGFPYSIVEAMRSGCAIIATRVGGIPEAIENEKEGLLIVPASTADITSALRRLIPDEALRNRLGKGAYQRFTQHFSLQAMQTQLREVMNKTVT
jgi:glycosyltransferase involved in cell wall biosynthesis